MSFAPDEIVLSTAPVLGRLASLLPEASCRGGAFGHLLPDPRAVSPVAREARVAALRAEASDLCAIELARAAGVDVRGVRHRQGGDRDWPAGLVGSLTHKGTIVLGAIAPRASVSALGIDLELIGRGARELAHLVAPEGYPPELPDVLGPTFVFSAKEAVFKAVYPLIERRLAFEDVVMAGVSEASSERFLATARVEEQLDVQVRVSVHEGWLVAAALIT